MGNTPIYVWNKVPSVDIKDGQVTGSEQSTVSKSIEERRSELRRLQDQQSYFLERIADSRVLVIEGISGSGKDTFQAYLKKKLEYRDVYDYSEGELLQSWNQLQIPGIFGLRIKFLKLFVNYVKEVIDREENAVFLLNRFHLSAYAMTVLRQPNLEKEYDQIIDILRTLPVHIFILQLDDNDIQQRSLHPERSATWQKFQQEIVKKEGFTNRIERYLWQQAVILRVAEKQKIPYSVIKFDSTPEVGTGPVGAAQDRSIRRDIRVNAADAKISRKKRRLPETV
jgi:hypothetical protein